MSLIQRKSIQKLSVEIHRDRAAMGQAAAVACAQFLQALLKKQSQARVIFACAPSQDEFLTALIAASRASATAFAWEKITAFHMDDYVGFAAEHPQSFRRYLHEHLLQHINLGAFHPLPAELPPQLACEKYRSLLTAAPIDLICLGIGENGHLAFNDPPVANFNDPAVVKVVDLDLACRQQQVNDGCFPNLSAVPTQALTLTLPVFRQAHRLSVHVPGPRKAAAVHATLHGPIATSCPATLLREHPNATLYLDTDSAALLPA